MKYPKNIPASVRQRLLNRAKRDRRPFNELLQYYAIKNGQHPVHGNKTLEIEMNHRKPTIDHFQKALQINPDYVNARNHLGNLLRAQKYK